MDARAFAELLCGYCLEVAERQQILVRSSTLAAPLLLELQRSILERGAWPLLRVELPGQTEGYYAHARDFQLDDYAAVAFEEAKRANATLGIQAPENTRALSAIDPDRLARANRARKPIRDQTLKRRWCSTLWPTEAGAQQAGTSLRVFEAFVARALFLDQPDPVASWGELRAFQSRLIDRLERADAIRIEAEGTDLTLRVKGRTWVNSDGRRNMPSGEVFTGPLEASADGTIFFDVPSSPAGIEVAGVTMRFSEGVVAEAHAQRGDAYLQRALRTDDGARRLGELGIGTNFGIDRPVGAILFDEKIGGTVHLALGRSYPETGGRNESALHWDLICDLRRGGRITADGEVIQENGRFVAR
ncbi:aminopeptidase [Capillimicrobium parvum]|uniref:Aminopeptidase 2 n=1 Tax=Capillimicrobium parvum TaxID=2884022 RepID=A0A9E6XT93_9ACTN|nr:aminopeptidase [Capillimicrobium parvum]UGS34106.1 Aminopeptidase 2 [Capillimicrobium parvum]